MYSWPLVSQSCSFISTKSCGCRLFPWRGFGRFLFWIIQKKRRNRREVKGAMKGCEQHAYRSLILLCSLNSTIHLTNRLFFVVCLVIFLFFPPVYQGHFLEIFHMCSFWSWIPWLFLRVLVWCFLLLWTSAIRIHSFICN